MKRGLTIIVLIILAILALVFISRLRLSGNIIISVENVTSSNYLINIQNFAYTPYELSIKVGDTVQWMNLDTAQHTVTSDNNGELNSLLLEKGDSYSHTFRVVGEYSYHCTPHPYMKGKIIVE